MLGLIKISRAKYNRGDIFLNFQIYRCKKFLYDKCKDSVEGLKLLTYFVDLKKAKELDKDFCTVYYKLLKEALDVNPSLSSLKNYATLTAKKLLSLEAFYKSILERFPDALEAKEMYGSLLSNILNNKQEASFYFSSADTNLLLSKQTSKNLKSFTKERCFMIVCGEIGSIGKILHANKNLLNFLKISEEYLEEYNISQFIPKSVNNDHNKSILKFIYNCKSTTVINCKPLQLLDSEGYLNECVINSECIADGDKIYIVCTLDPVDKPDRDIALIGLNGEIYCHSKNFPWAIGSNEHFLHSNNIKAMIPELDLENLEKNKIASFSF